MTDRLIGNSSRESIVKSPFQDPGQSRGRQHSYDRVGEFLIKGTEGILIWSLKRPITVGGIGVGIVMGSRDNLSAAFLYGITGGVIGEIFDRISSPKV